MAITIEQRATAANMLSPELARYRALIRRERRRRYLGTAAIGVGATWLVLALLGLFDTASPALALLALALTVLIPAVALLYEAWRQPTLEQTAASLDSLLDNRSGWSRR